MADEAVDIGRRQARPAEDRIEGRREFGPHEGRQRLGEHDAEPVSSIFQPMMSRLSGKEMFAGALDRRDAALPRPHHAGRRAVAEQGGRDQIDAGRLVEAEGERAEFDDDEEHVGAGRAAASRAAMPRPETPPAQPRPNTGTRSMSDRNPISGATCASRLGVVKPVEDSVTTQSMSAGASPARAMASRALSRKRVRAPSAKAAMRSAQPWGSWNQASGRTERRSGCQH